MSNTRVSHSTKVSKCCSVSFFDIHFECFLFTPAQLRVRLHARDERFWRGQSVKIAWQLLWPIAAAIRADFGDESDVRRVLLRHFRAEERIRRAVLHWYAVSALTTDTEPSHKKNCNGHLDNFTN